MRTCPVCGAAYPNHDVICAKDGTQLVASSWMPGRARVLLAVALALAIATAGLAFGMPTSKIVKQADELHKAHHYKLSKILRNLACARGNGEGCAGLGRDYYSVENYTRAAALYSKACDIGYCPNLRERLT